MKAAPARPTPRSGALNSRSGRLRFITGALGTAVLLSGCSRSPSQDILGSFFPSWLLCLGLGLLIAVGSRLAMGWLGFRDDVPVPLLTDLAVALAATFLIWLLWFGH